MATKSSVVVMELPLQCTAFCCQHDQPFRNGAAQLPAIALNTDNVVLTAIANDRYMMKCMQNRCGRWVMREMYCSHFHPWQQPRYCKSGRSCRSRDMTIVALTGYDGGELAGL